MEVVDPPELRAELARMREQYDHTLYAVSDTRPTQGARRYRHRESAARPGAVAVALQRPLLRRALLVAVVAVHVLFVPSPLDVLAPVVAHDIGQLLLHGNLPYRDFPFEYPPLAALMFILPGLAPADIADQVLALQAVALEVLLVVVVLKPMGKTVAQRWAVASVLVFRSSRAGSMPHR